MQVAHSTLQLGQVAVPFSKAPSLQAQAAVDEFRELGQLRQVVELFSQVRHWYPHSTHSPSVLSAKYPATQLQTVPLRADWGEMHVSQTDWELGQLLQLGRLAHPQQVLDELMKVKPLMHTQVVPDSSKKFAESHRVQVTELEHSEHPTMAVEHLRQVPPLR